MTDLKWEDNCLFYMPAMRRDKIALLGWVFHDSTDPDVWVARSTDGVIRAEFPTEAEGRAFLSLVLGATS